MDPGLVEDRVEDLISQMTLDEKIQLVHGVEEFEVTTGYIEPLSRLDIPGLYMIDGPVGVGFGRTATAFPVTVALAATWDLDLARDEGVALGDETKALGQDVLLAPALNIDRVSFNGRTFEYYSEDPYLTSRMVVETIKGIQSVGTIATAKHYAANNQETNRQEINANVSERALREIYLPGFEAAVREGNVGAVMAAYNRVNGTFSSENEQLLTDILKDEWGFEGFVMSDWHATRNTVPAANAGLDLEMPEGNRFGEELRQAVLDGEVSEATLEDKVRRILRQMGLSGALDGKKAGGPGSANTSEHQQLARTIAENGAVLLKRDDSTLPLDEQEIESIAVIGAGADTAKLGGGGSSVVTPPYSVSPLEGIRERAGSGISVEYATIEEFAPVPSSVLAPSGSTGGAGLRGEYFNNADLSGEPELVRLDEQIDFNLQSESPASQIDSDDFSVRWTGTLTAPATGEYTLALTSDDGSYLYLDGELVIDNGGAHAAQTRSYDVELEAGESYQIRVEYTEIDQNATIRLDWLTPDARGLVEEAVELARRSDVAVVIATDDSTEGEDRESLGLSFGQNELISAVAAANERTVVVLRTGGPVLMPWIEDVPNVLEIWYSGMEEGNALASLLFGDTNPSGKLPITFGATPEDYPTNTREQYPGVDLEADYSEDVFVGYRHFDERDIQPLFAFGHGLSYTVFDYGNLRVELNEGSREATDDGSASASGFTVEVSAQVQNSGSLRGAEVAQLYVGFPETEGEPMPPKQLKGFQKISLGPAQTKRVSFELDERALSYWDTEAGDWVMQSGTYRVMVGGSSRDIRMEDTFDSE